MAEEKKNKTSSWNFEIDAEANKAVSVKSSAADRLKEQAAKNKESSIKNIKVEQRKITLTRTQIAEKEEKSRIKDHSNVPPELRQKAALIDTGYILALYFISTSAPVMNPIALKIIQIAKDQNVPYYIEKLPDFKLILALSLFFIFTVFFYLLPIMFSARSPGKFITGIRIEDIEGGYPSRKNILIRETIGKLINLSSLIGVFKTLLDKQGRGFHDKMTDTVVLKIPPKAPKDDREKAV